MAIFLVDESSPSCLLARKASKIRLETKDWAVRSKSQESAWDMKAMLRKYFVVPLEMMVDPICLLMNLYAAFVYAIIYL